MGEIQVTIKFKISDKKTDKGEVVQNYIIDYVEAWLKGELVKDLSVKRG